MIVLLHPRQSRSRASSRLNHLKVRRRNSNGWSQVEGTSVVPLDEVKNASWLHSMNSNFQSESEVTRGFIRAVYDHAALDAVQLAVAKIDSGLSHFSGQRSERLQNALAQLVTWKRDDAAP